jgi:hypothetical protein
MCYLIIKLEYWKQVYRILGVEIKFLNIKRTAGGEGDRLAKY